MTVREIMDNNCTAFEKATEEVTKRIVEETRRRIEQLFFPRRFEFVVTVFFTDKERCAIHIGTDDDYNYETVDSDVVTLKEKLLDFAIIHVNDICGYEEVLFKNMVLKNVERELIQEGGQDTRIPGYICEHFEFEEGISVKFRVWYLKVK